MWNTRERGVPESPTVDRWGGGGGSCERYGGLVVETDGRVTAGTQDHC